VREADTQLVSKLTDQDSSIDRLFESGYQERVRLPKPDSTHLDKELPPVLCCVHFGSNADGSIHDNHTLLYDFNDEELPFGIAYWIIVAQQELALT